MRTYHLCQRNKHFHFVSRVPADLLQYFPCATLSFSLKTKDSQFAKAQVGAIDAELITIYTLLRSPMIDARLAEYVVNKFLLAKLIKIRQRDQRSARASKTRKQEIAKEEENFTSRGMDLRTAGGRQNRSKFLQEEIDRLKTDFDCQHGRSQAKHVAARYGVTTKLKSDEREWLGRQIQDAEIEALEIEREIILVQKARLQPRIDELKKKCESGYMLLSDVLRAYQEYYPTTTAKKSLAAEKDCARECGILLELIGDVPINIVNKLETITKLKKILQRLPNKQGYKSAKSVANAKPIKPQTANKYLTRLNAILRFANDSRWLTHNPIIVDLFPVEEMPHEARKAYTAEDFARLADALCTKPLWERGTSKNERFWAVLFALYHGIEASRMFGIKKEFVCCQDDLWYVDAETWTTGKNAYRITHNIAIHEDLIKIGFADWVQSLPDGPLWSERHDNFGQWFNRKGHDLGSGTITGIGFEQKWVTTDDKKCLYSTRHSLAGGLHEEAVDIKIIKEVMGHSPDKRDNTRARYPNPSSVKRQAMDTCKYRPFTAEDVERLRVKATELFNL